jgi:hypothetical protein
MGCGEAVHRAHPEETVLEQDDSLWRLIAFRVIPIGGHIASLGDLPAGTTGGPATKVTATPTKSNTNDWIRSSSDCDGAAAAVDVGLGIAEIDRSTAASMEFATCAMSGRSTTDRLAADSADPGCASVAAIAAGASS